MLDGLLSTIRIPSVMSQDNAEHNRDLVTEYYESITQCIKRACWATIPHSYKRHSDKDYFVAGWNDVVKDKHSAAKAAYLDWMADGRPHNGPLFTLMSRTRATFKLALRYCRDHQDKLRDDSYAKNLAHQDFKSFWKDISKRNNAKSTKYANTIGSSSGEQNITEMWRSHFEQLYNSVNDNGFKALWMIDYRIAPPMILHIYVITVHKVLECVSKRKKLGKLLALMALQ